MAAVAAEPQGWNGVLTEEQKKAAEAQRTARMRDRQGLEMQRERILSQRTAHPARRQALEAALAQIEGELAKLG